MSRRLEVRRGTYRDSVRLMQVSRTLQSEPGVAAALVAMATDLNLDLLEDMGFDRPAGATPSDMLVALEADDDMALSRAVGRLDDALAERPTVSDGPVGVPSPRTISSAAQRLDGTLALVSTAGSHAFVEAMDALDAGLSVMVFSDNVPLEQEIALKETAAARDLLVMGPDCGTAVVGGVALGFANVVKPGPVGLVAASGTGAQHVMSLLDAADVGISHCLGVGGRDLSAAVAGRSTLAALDLLAADAATEQIVVISKPPDDAVAENVRRHAATLGKPVHFALLGPAQPDLTASAAEVVRAVGGHWEEPRWWPAPVERTGSYPTIRGLFSGGTLCEEALVIAEAVLGPVRSNVPFDEEHALGDDLDPAGGHAMIDFGDDRLTRGRPHPMIDSSLRMARVLAESADPTCGVLLLDVVLGHSAHPDPASELVPAIQAAHQRAAANGREVAVVIALVGTADDPQGLERQALGLRDAGASVHLSNAAAARKAVELVKDAP